MILKDDSQGINSGDISGHFFFSSLVTVLVKALLTTHTVSTETLWHRHKKARHFGTKDIEF